MVLDIYRGKTVLITGHTGFKGSWLSIWLNELGARVIGYSLKRYPNDYLFKKTNLKEKIIDKRGDIRNLKKLRKIFLKYKPEIVFHLAAQPLVRKSYEMPLKTFETNAIGTANVLECIKEFNFVKTGILITTDKVYKNKESKEGYKEEDELGGYDPYSSSKACAEIIIKSYKDSFFNNKLIAPVRAGNVIGGGDYSENRLIPDCIKALNENVSIKIRNPLSVRPWQYVVEPIYGYLLLGEKLLNGEKSFVGAWNFGPNKSSIVKVKYIVNSIIKYWGSGEWIDISDLNEEKHETKLLVLNSDKARKELGWKPKLDIEKTIKYTVDWYKRCETEDAYNICVEQINDYIISKHNLDYSLEKK